MAIETFNRYENKYLLNADTFDKIQSKLSDYMELDTYNKQYETYKIVNLYYDTPHNHLIRTSLHHPKYKEKLRIRAYNIPDSDTTVYVEIKKKVAGLVNKRRSALLLREAYAFLHTGLLPDMQPYQNRQVLHEVAYILENHTLHPALYLVYDRKAYFGAGQHDLRVSFDHNICTRRYDLAMERGDYGTPLLRDDQWLMEIKTAQSIPVWLCQLLSEHKVYPTRFSKYGVEYRQTLENRTPRHICFFATDTSSRVPAPAVASNA